MVINLRTAKALGPFVNPLAKTHLMCCLSGLMSRPKRIHEFIFRTGQGELKEGAARCTHICPQPTPVGIDDRPQIDSPIPTPLDFVV
jgi:hypothetical protein